MTTSRLEARATESFQDLARQHHIIILLVGLVVVLRLGSYLITGYMLLTDQIPQYRLWQVASTALGAALDVILFLIVWGLFSAFRRIERQTDRLQTFMDHMYRRDP